jgi:endogenous inhibitor of DNA gyrase (YacG/DUF329 family)
MKDYENLKVKCFNCNRVMSWSGKEIIRAIVWHLYTCPQCGIEVFTREKNIEEHD